GVLTDAIPKTPYAVLVLDEIEKAHPDLFDILLQVMDHATLTDNNGKKADFRNVIVIMTTNAGARDMTNAAIGFNAVSDTAQASGDRGLSAGASKAKRAIRATFSPRFANPFDAPIKFNHLSLADGKGCAEKLIGI